MVHDLSLRIISRKKVRYYSVMLNKIFFPLLKLAVRFLPSLNKRLISVLGKRIFKGLHPKNYFNYRYEFFLENVNSNSVVVDIACGTGLILNKISGEIKSGIGIDADKKNIVIWENKHNKKNLKYIYENIFKVDYKSLKEKTSYNTAIFSHILEHIENVQELIKKVDADIVLVCVPSQENWYTQLLIFLGLPYFKDRTHFREYTRSMLSNELTASGYDIELIGFNQEGEIICKANKRV